MSQQNQTKQHDTTTSTTAITKQSRFTIHFKTSAVRSKIEQTSSSKLEISHRWSAFWFTEWIKRLSPMLTAFGALSVMILILPKTKNRDQKGYWRFKFYFRWSKYEVHLSNILIPSESSHGTRFLLTRLCLSPRCLISPHKFRGDKLRISETEGFDFSSVSYCTKISCRDAASTHHLNVHNVPSINNIVFDFNSIHLIFIRR